MDLGGEGLDEQDHYLLEINLDDLETSSGKDQHYWLLQIKAARRKRMPYADCGKREQQC